MKTFFAPRRHPNKVADEFRTQAVECYEIADRYHDLMKEQYEALARQCLMIAAQASPLRM
jgi:hypothetical protein